MEIYDLPPSFVLLCFCFLFHDSPVCFFTIFRSSSSSCVLFSLVSFCFCFSFPFSSLLCFLPFLVPMSLSSKRSRRKKQRNEEGSKRWRRKKDRNKERQKIRRIFGNLFCCLFFLFCFFFSLNIPSPKGDKLHWIKNNFWEGFFIVYFFIFSGCLFLVLANQAPYNTPLPKRKKQNKKNIKNKTRQR